MSPNILEERIWSLLDGTLDEEEFAELEALLEESPAARALFIEQVDQHNLLELCLHKPTLGSLTCGVVPVDALVAKQRKKMVRFSAFAAAALLVIAAIALSVVFVREQMPLATFQASEHSIFTVTHLPVEGKEPSFQTLEIGSRLELSQGAVELTLANGVTSLVRAPADLTLVREDRVYQERGVSLYKVPAKAAGFQVQTLNLLITDLGTEFGVISSKKENDEVHLFNGKLKVQNRLGLLEEETLSKRGARQATAVGRLKEVPPRPKEFLSTLPKGIPHLHFSFEPDENQKFEVKGSHSDGSKITTSLERGEVSADEEFLVPGKFGQGLRLHGKGDFIRTDWPGIGGETGRTVAFWLKLPSREVTAETRQGILVWGDTHISGGKFSVTWNGVPECGVVGAIRFDCGEGYVVGDRVLRDGQWHHIAVVFGGGMDPVSRMRVQLYVDGQLETPSGSLFAEPNTVIGGGESTWMSIGRFFDVDVQYGDTLEAELDELYIFSGVLAPQSIQKLMESGW